MNGMTDLQKIAGPPYKDRCTRVEEDVAFGQVRRFLQAFEPAGEPISDRTAALSRDDRVTRYWRASEVSTPRRQIMATNYANEKLMTAIRNHLLNVDALAPTAKVSKLAGELAEVCLTELETAGLSSQGLETLFAPAAFKAKAQGVD